ncbi:MAG: type 4a pilus biogenesis protein PilO [Methylococcales bacterium]
MNLSEVNWDFNAAGSWPLLIKIGTIILAGFLVVAGLVYYITLDQLNELKQLQQKERALKAAFEAKQRKAINLPEFREQLQQIEASLGEMIIQLPTKAEVASLLIDISQTGLASGLEFHLFKPTVAIRKEFYSELPISIQVVGQYQELSLFVSGLASLPRIVTVHNVSIFPLVSPLLTMNATIKTYNVETGEIKKKGRRGNHDLI